MQLCQLYKNTKTLAKISHHKRHTTTSKAVAAKPLNVLNWMQVYLIAYAIFLSEVTVSTEKALNSRD